MVIQKLYGRLKVFLRAVRLARQCKSQVQSLLWSIPFPQSLLLLTSKLNILVRVTSTWSILVKLKPTNQSNLGVCNSNRLSHWHSSWKYTNRLITPRPGPRGVIRIKDYLLVDVDDTSCVRQKIGVFVFVFRVETCSRLEQVIYQQIWRKEMFYLMMHSTHYLLLHGISQNGIWPCR